MRILYLAGVVLAAWALVCAWYYFRQEAVIFQPSRLPADHQFAFDRPFEEHRIEVEPGVELSALLFPASGIERPESARPGYARPEPAGRVVLYLHGNAGHLQDWGWHADLYVEAGYDFLVIDYRGYGKSGGRVESEAQLHADIDRVWGWTTARYAPSDVTLVGYSLGAALAARLACESEPPARLILLAPFYSARDMARHLVPYVPIGLLRYPLRTDVALTECRPELPIAIFHGERDRTVPFSQGRRLADLLGSRARLVPLPDATHQDIAADPLFRREMVRLLNPNEAGRAPAHDTRGTPDG